MARRVESVPIFPEQPENQAPGVGNGYIDETVGFEDAIDFFEHG